MNRRLFVATVTAGAVSASAGCLSGVLEDMIDEETTFEASPIRVSETAAEEAGYEYLGTTEQTEERDFGGQTVELTNYHTEYTRSIELPLEGVEGETEAGVFSLISTPQIRVAEEEFNPVGDLTTEELAGQIQDRYESLELGDNIGGRAIEPEGPNTMVSFDTYEATATLSGGTELDVYLDIALPEHDFEYLVVAAIYPAADAVFEDERDRVNTMATGLEHGETVSVDLVDEFGSGSGGDDDDDGSGGENSSNTDGNETDGDSE
ncbi:DUF6517 family protein [Natronorubrum thiooxidans]|uniref:Uncharacterized protein n=1 Tax=Natronorubrum thiooxidans TaxID=308853 RepID=A0A1N7E837_9EURY|nr:DUF6517 family protein [Natronorubrum thiooxidans]SIR84178.1 hypothetical protein SAMN05421752_103284 [Natronorubrum thiooxidans]